MSEHRSLFEFRNPKLSDRELMLLVLCELTNLRADVLAFSQMIAQKAAGDRDKVATIQVEAHRQALADLESVMRQFETRRIPPK